MTMAQSGSVMCALTYKVIESFKLRAAPVFRVHHGAHGTSRSVLHPASAGTPRLGDAFFLVLKKTTSRLANNMCFQR